MREGGLERRGRVEGGGRVGVGDNRALSPRRCCVHKFTWPLTPWRNLCRKVLLLGTLYSSSSPAFPHQIKLAHST